MPVSNDDDTGTVATVGRPRPTLTFETYALYSSAITAAAFGLELVRCGGRSLVGVIGFFAALLTFGLLAYDVGQKSSIRGAKTRSNVAGSSLVQGFSGYDFGPSFSLRVGESAPLPPDFDAGCVVVFYTGGANKVETSITGVANCDCSIRYINNPNKNIPTDPDHIAVSP
ncbi:MAG: hypothetical protein ABJC13_09105 [Acidobacteriota bacterium]